MTLSVLFVALAQASYYFIFFAFIPLSIIFRFFIVYKSPLRKSAGFAMVALDFTSFSFFYYLKGKSKGVKIYAIFLLVSFLLACLGLASGIHIFLKVFKNFFNFF